jgi:hypothetical protein
MADPQQVVDDIRSFLDAADQTDARRLGELAEAYAEACKAANQRLRRCDEFLKKGLRSEAIHFAQAEPVLLDLVAVLDFPERPRLEEVLLVYGIAPPPRLQLETAEELNRAYAQEQPLGELRRRHRRLALARAPLDERLDVLRQVAMLDAQNPVWLDDLRTFEEARFRQIDAELARPGLSARQVFRLAGELEQTAWQSPPPEPLTRQARALAKRYGREQARGELEEVVGQLRQAMMAADPARGIALRDRYREALARAALPADDPLVGQGDRLLDWLAGHERAQAAELEFRHALAGLEAAMDEEADAEDVARLYFALANRGHAVPEHVAQRYRDYVASSDRSRTWRERLILLSVFFAGAVVLLGLLGYLWLKGRRAPATAGLGPAARTVAVLTAPAETSEGPHRAPGGCLPPADA